MFYADCMGPKYNAERLGHYAGATGAETLRLARLLASLAAKGKGSGDITPVGKA